MHGNNGYQLVFFGYGSIVSIQERQVLEVVGIQLVIGQSIIGQVVVGELHNLQVISQRSHIILHQLQDFSMRRGGCAHNHGSQAFCRSNAQQQ